MNESLFHSKRNFCSLPSPYCDEDRAQVVVVPVPYEATVTYRRGTADGPEAIVDASAHLELYDIELGREISKMGIYTCPDVEPDTSGPEQMVRRVEQVIGDVLKMDKMPVMLGGEHSLTVGAVRAAKQRYPDLSVLQLDAHADLRDEYLGSPYNHACTMRRVREICPAVQVGIRSMSTEEVEYIEQEDIRLYYADKIDHTDAFDDIIASLSQAVYITVDMDVFDPSIMPAVGTPQPGGLDWRTITGLLKEVGRARRIVGFDLVEMSPAEGPVSCAFTAAKLAYKLMGYASI